MWVVSGTIRAGDGLTRSSWSRAACFRLACDTGVALPVWVWHLSPALAPHSGHSKSMAFMATVYADILLKVCGFQVNQRPASDREWDSDFTPTVLDESYRSAFYRLTRCAHPGSPCPSLLAGDQIVLRGNHLPLAIALWPGVGPDLALLLVGMRLVSSGSHSSESCALRNRPVSNAYRSVEIESNAKLFLAWHVGRRSADDALLAEKLRMPRFLQIEQIRIGFELAFFMNSHMISGCHAGANE